MKYIIELEDTPISVKDSHTGEAYDVYKAKEFRSLVFDMNGLQKLERYDRRAGVHEAYERGKAYQEEQDKEKIKKAYFDGVTEGRQQAEEHDGCQGCYYEPCGEDEEPCRSCKYRYASQYRRSDDEIRVGDEVVVNGLTGVVMRLDEKGNVDRYFTSDGRTFGNISGFQNNEVIKTGRHFPEVEKLLKEMKR